MNAYEIIRKHINRVGYGKKDKKNYFEGSVSIIGLKGKFRIWEQENYFRKELNLGEIKWVEGENNHLSWEIDINGQIELKKDENSLIRKKIKDLIRNYKFVDSKEKIIKPLFSGIQEINGKQYYVIKLSNIYNNEVIYHFFNIKTYFLERIEELQIEKKIIIERLNFQLIDGMFYPKHTIKTILPYEQREIYNFHKFEKLNYIDKKLFEPTKGNAKKYFFLRSNNVIRVPFKFIHNTILLRIEINGNPCFYGLDSAAQSDIIDSQYVKELKLNSFGSLKGGGGGLEKTIGNFVKISNIRLGNLEIKNQIVTTKNFNGIEKFKDYKMVGILGYDFLSNFVTKIDYPNKIISIYDPDKFTYNGNGVIFKSSLIDKIFFIPVLIDNAYNGKVMLDTGSCMTSFTYSFTTEHKLNNLDGIDQRISAFGGNRKYKMVRMNKIKIGKYTVNKPIIALPQEERKGLFTKICIGTLGNSILKEFIIYLDYKNHKAIFEKRENK
jgi:hypothetical protein